ncbi:hypothetical protein GCM10020220_051520 [Nonomuraea rubra]
MTAVNAAPGSGQPAKAETTRMWALEEIGRNSVSPWTNPKITASSQPITTTPLVHAGVTRVRLAESGARQSLSSAVRAVGAGKAARTATARAGG